MKILSVECSAGPASCAIIDDGILRASACVNARLTHSQTLMPMIINMLDNSATKLTDIDKIAIAVGPGSFTGLRIGISVVKGLAAPANIPCVAVSTLDAMAEQFSDRNCIVCAVMDARCNQFYNALFDINDGTITRMCEDRALIGEELKEEILNLTQEKTVIICGDGADLFYKSVSEDKNVLIAPQNLKYQSAIGVGMFAYKYADNSTLSYSDLLPTYLRLPQAERELKAKTEAKK